MYSSRLQKFIAGSVFAVAILAAQGTGAKPPSTGGTTGGTTGTPTGGTVGTPSLSTTNPRLGTNPTTTIPGDTVRPVFLTGKVSLADGTLPGEPVMIQRVCNGNPHSEGYTDSKGNFSIQLGQNHEVADASEMTTRSTTHPDPLGGFSEQRMNNCELRAALAGFRSDVISLASRRYMDNPEVGTIVLHRLVNVEGLTISATSALAPKEARKSFEKGLSAEKDIRPDDAQKEFEKAVAMYPRYAAAWLELGLIFEQRDRFAEARNAYNQAIVADAKFVNPHQRLYLLAVRESKWREVAEITDHIIHLNPYDFADAYYFNGLSNLELGKLDAAEKSAREALKLDGGHRNPKTNYILGLVLARKSDFQGASEYLRAYLKDAGDSKDAERVRKQLADVERYAQAKAQAQPPQ